MLEICKNLFGALKAAQIRYCHWKSNEHLSAGLEGETDLDILIHSSDASAFRQAARKLRFIEFSPVWYLKYDNIEDYIGMDEAEGKLVHLHVHHQLMIGRKFIKNYSIPWEKAIFENLLFIEEYGIYTICPEIELLLLIVRRSAKNRMRFRASGGKNFLSKDEVREWNWLVQRIDREKLDSYAAKLLSSECADQLACALAGETARFPSLSRLIRKTILPGCLVGKGGAYTDFRYLARKISAASAFLMYKKIKANIPYRRKLPGEGIIVAIMGIDGSGKSTVIRQLSDFLSWKIDFYSVYFGSGDGSSSLLRLPLLWLAKKRSAARGDARRIDKASKEKMQSKNSHKFAKFLWAALLVLEKKKKMVRAQAAKRRGLIVVSDRYPQARRFGVNDGPLLAAWLNGKNRAKKKIAEWELDSYRRLAEQAPDLLIKLRIPIDVALERKKDTPEYVLMEKVSAVADISYEGARTVEIPTDCPVAETMRSVKLAIWDEIASRYAG